jgi:LL-diaminopimelate aminotransferase
MTSPLRFSKRYENLKPYPFARQAERIAQLKTRGVDVIRMDIGSPDRPPAPHILQALADSIQRPDVHGYPPLAQGSPSFLQAVAAYYAARFGVTIDPAREALALIGSKEGIFHISQALLEPGDVALVPNPGYPVYRIAAEWAGAEVFPLPLKRERGFLPDLDSIPTDILARAKLFWLNYPNNPTGAMAGDAFYKQAIDLAHSHNILICHDAAYCDVVFDGYRPKSILQFDDARETAVEFNSLSKTYNMAGWRIGMLVGKTDAVQALRRVKSNVDSGIFTALLAAGEAALTGDQQWLQPRNAEYSLRRDLILEGLRAIGIESPKPAASLYIWAPVPAGRQSEEYADALLEETGVCFSPGTFFGAEGEGYLRISLGAPTDRIQEAMDRLRKWKRK